jgi:hypothetical protein
MLEIVLHLKQPFLENKTKLIETLTFYPSSWPAL